MATQPFDQDILKAVIVETLAGTLAAQAGCLRTASSGTLQALWSCDDGKSAGTK